MSEEVGSDNVNEKKSLFKNGFSNDKKKGIYKSVPQDPKSTDNEKKSCLRPFKGYLFAFLAICNFSIGNIIIKKVKLLSAIDHLAIFFFGSILILPFIVRWKKEPLLGKKSQRFLLSMRAFTQLIALVFFYSSVKMLAPSEVSALGNASIIVTAILSKIFLKETFGMPHFVSILLIISGVFLIAKPEFLFPSDEEAPQLNSIPVLNSTHSVNDNSIKDNSDTKLIGMIFTLLSAFAFSVVTILTKKISDTKIHWSLTNLYAGYIGLPFSVLISYLLYHFEYTSINLENGIYELIFSIAYSFLSACFKVVGISFFTMSFKYEDATKIMLVKKSDIFVYLILQAIFLNIIVDKLSILGSMLLLCGNLVVLGNKVYQERNAKKNKNKNLV